MYILAPNQTAEKYPYSIGELRRDNPNTSFPRKPSDELLAEWGVFLVTRTERPEYHALTENLTEGTAELIDDEWRQTWVISPASEEEIAERREAYKVLLQAAVDSHIETTAQSKNYNSSLSLLTYLGDEEEDWAEEAKAFASWRSSVWRFVISWLTAVENGTQAPPESVEALIDALPEMEWPE